ncbi:MAG: hypothetical protein R3F08_14830 [Dokdonella sp.]
MRFLKLASLVAFLLFFPQLVGAEELLARNASRQLLHDVSDYLDWIPEEILPQSERTAMLDPANSSFGDHRKKDGAGYQLTYQFHTQQVLAFTTLVVTDRKGGAAKAAEGFMKLIRLNMEKQGHQLRPIKAPAEFPYSAELYTEVADGVPFGNVFVITHGEHMYASRIAGGGGFERFEETSEYLTPKLKAAMEFTPQLD